MTTDASNLMLTPPQYSVWVEYNKMDPNRAGEFIKKLYDGVTWWEENLGQGFLKLEYRDAQNRLVLVRINLDHIVQYRVITNKLDDPWGVFNKDGKNKEASSSYHGMNFPGPDYTKPESKKRNVVEIGRHYPGPGGD